MVRTRMFRALALSFGLAIASLSASAAVAAPTPALSADDQALVDRAAGYFSNLGEVKGRFVQTDPHGGVSQGEVFLKRPGLARLAYDPPSSRLVVSDGSNVYVSDPRLRTFDRYPLGATPLSLFLSRDVRVDRGVQIVRVDHLADSFAITARDARHPRAGTVTLTFSNNNRLLEWDLTDAQGSTVRVRLVSLEPTSGLDPALFVLRDTRPGRGASIQ